MKQLLVVIAFLALVYNADAQIGKKINVGRAVKAGASATKALTLTDAEIAKYCDEYMDWMDKHNPVCNVTDTDPGKKAVAERLAKIIEGAPDIKELNLDVRAYYVIDQNAFAVANGTIRVFAGLMDIMTDEQILGIVGHEVGHIVNKDSKDAFRTALLTSALKDGVASTGGTAAALSDSQIGELGTALVGATYSQKQEYAADDYGYEFLKKAKKDPKGMASALRVIQKLQDDASAGGKSPKVNQLFSSHPESAKRAQRLDDKFAAENK